MNEKPISISASALELVKECNASNDDREPSPITKGPHLFRWTQVKRAIVDWFVNQADEEMVIKKVHKWPILFVDYPGANMTISYFDKR